MEWITIAWEWICNNITPLLMSGNISMVLGVLCSLAKQKTVIRDNTANSKELNSVLKEAKKQTEANEQQAETITEIKKELAEIQEIFGQINAKTEAIIEVQQIVYNASAALKTETRTTINDILTNAKYSTTKTRADILKQLSALQEKAQKAAEEQAKEAEKIKEIVSSESTINLA